MTTTASTPAAAQSYDNNGQYSRSGILRYEKIFGAGYVSTGGPETTAYLCSKLGPALHEGVHVLDVGSGIGGAAFHLAREYGAKVTGIDLADEMVRIAQERRQQWGTAQAVTFLKADILTADFQDPFDIVWSRDALMHIADKPQLFARLHDLLVSGGKLIITDYARGAGSVSPEFQAYAQETGYHLTDPASYGKLLKAAGFATVEVEDATDKFIEILKREPKQLADRRGDFLQSFTEDDLAYLEKRWAMKVRFCQAGDMKWGIYLATKRA
jgi:phosphoethanolamine N-methyltransferase